MDIQNNRFSEGDLSHEALIPVCVNVINRTLLYCKDSTTSPYSIFLNILEKIVGNRNPKIMDADANDVFNGVINWAYDTMLNWSPEELDSYEETNEEEPGW